MPFSYCRLSAPLPLFVRSVRKNAIAVFLLLVGAMATLPFAQAFGQTAYTVTRFDDTSTGTLEPGGGFGPGVSGDLRYGLFQAMANGGANTISFACSTPPCTITLQAPLPPIFELSNASSFSLTIDGGTEGNILLDGNGGAGQSNRVFFVDNVAVTLKNLVIQNALAKGGDGAPGAAGGGGGGAGFGAGLFVNQPAAAVVVQNTTFNRCAVSGGAGGAVDGRGSYGGGGGLAFVGGSGSGQAGGGGGGVSGVGGDVTISGVGGNGGAGGGGGGGGFATGSLLGGIAYAANGPGSPGDFVLIGEPGGFGGGGGGGSENPGAGGFGGGGGSAFTAGGAGGFGGGAGAGTDPTYPTAAAVGGVQGGSGSEFESGGGGAAAGAAIFVVSGSVTVSNTTGSGFMATPGNGGSNVYSSTADTSPVFNYGGTVNGSTATGGLEGALPVGGSTSGTVYGGTPVGQTSDIQTATLWITTAGTPAAINVLTEGAPKLDFNAVSGGSCATGTSYHAGQNCTVNFNFAALHPGTRMGGITLTDSSGNVLATTLISGLGTGPQVTFKGSGTTINNLGGGFRSPEGVAVDGSGTVFVTDYSNNSVSAVPAGCASSNCVKRVGGGFRSPSGIAIDGAGNVYVGDSQNSAVKQIPAGCYDATCVNLLGGGFSVPEGVAVDKSGNVFVADLNNNAIKVMPPSCASANCVSTLGGNFSGPSGVAIDGNGVVYVADQSNDAIKMMASGCTNASCVITLPGSYYQPDGVTVDAGGNVYVADQLNNAIKVIPAGCTNASCVTTLQSFSFPGNLALDGAGNLYVPGNGSVQEIALATPPAVSFATPTVEGTTDTTDGPQAMIVTNIGNASLSFSSPTPSISAGFSLGTESTSCVQLPGATLAAGSSCTLTTTFAPPVAQSGAITGSIALADNNLNQANAQQAIPLAGTSVAPPLPNVYLNLPTSIQLGGTTTLSFGAVNPSSTVALSNFSVSLTLPTGLRVVATKQPPFCSGSAAMVDSSAGTITFSGLSLAAGATCQSNYVIVGMIPGLQTVSLFASGNGQNGPTVSSSITVVDMPASLQITGVPSSAYVGGSFPFTVTVLDPVGNPDLDYTGTVSFTSSDQQAALPLPTTLTSGTGSFMATLYNVGSQSITVTDAANSLTATIGPIPVTIPNLVVTTNQDDAGTASNCTVQAAPGTGTDASCSLRDALAFANNNGWGNISFDKTAFSSSNTVAQNTITEGPAGTLAISSNTTITGPTTGTGVIADGAGLYPVFTMGAVQVFLNSLTITHGKNSGLGGGISQSGGSLTLNACTVTGNSASGGGGGLYTYTGRANVNASTFANNSSDQLGGGIYVRNSGLTVIGSTITGNSAGSGGGGIRAQSGPSSFVLANTIVSGNNGYGNDDDLSATGSGLTDDGGNVIDSSGINLSSLGSYGGLTQTVLPLPGSSSICAGTLANAQAAGLTTDQRGFVFNPACPAGSVDAGAVQTNYAVSFTADPPATTTPNTAMSPAPAVTVTESGIPLTAGPATLSVTDKASDLIGSPATASTSGGVATFNSLLFSSATTADTLTAKLPLNASLNLTATSKTFNVSQTTPTISFIPSVTSQTYGPPISGATLDATATANGSPVAGAFTYTTTISGAANQSVAAGATLLPVGSYLITATFTPANPSLYASASAQTSYSVNKANPTVIWASPAAITYGTSLSGAQLNATASIPGSFTYTPSSGVLNAGSHTLSVLFTPTDATDYNTATQTVTLIVSKANPTVTWATPAAITYGTSLSGAQLNATASIPGSFTYTPSSGVLNAGSHTLAVLFTPTDATDYNTATQTVTLIVSKANPTVTWATPAAITYGTSLSGAQLNATASIPGSFTYTPSSGVLNAGSHTLSVLFTPTDATDYNTATQTVTLIVSKANPTVTWATPAAITYGTSLSGAQLNATASIPGSFTYTPSSGVLNAGSHTLSVLFTPTDATDYNTATQTVTLIVSKANPTVTWATPAAITYGTSLSGAQLNATASIPGSFTYTPSSGVLNAGSHTLAVLFTPTDATDYNTATQTVTLIVSKANPTLTWATPAAITYGTSLGSAQLNATASIPGSFTYTPSSGVLGTGTQILSVLFTPTDSIDYSTAMKTVNLVVNKASTNISETVTTTQTVTGTTATITATIKPQIGGTPTGTVTYMNGSVTLGKAAVGTPFTTSVLPAGTDHITAVYSGDSNFMASSSSSTSVISLAPSIVQLCPASTKLLYPLSQEFYLVGVQLKDRQLTKGTITIYDGSIVLGTYTMPPLGTYIGITPSLSIGTHSLRAVYSGDSHYTPGQSPVITITVFPRLHPAS